MQKPILLVEDNSNDLELTLMALEKCHLNNQVHITRDGAEALDYIFSRAAYKDKDPVNPAVILLDLKMPKIDGLEVLSTIRATPELKSIPVVMLTSSKEEKDIASSYDKGVNAYVVKPIDFRDLIGSISQLAVFWTAINEPPVGSVRAVLPA
jgi:CheY-like chemotaxis protein